MQSVYLGFVLSDKLIFLTKILEKNFRQLLILLSVCLAGFSSAKNFHRRMAESLNGHSETMNGNAEDEYGDECEQVSKYFRDL